MRTLQIEEKTARKLYKTASQEFKATLEDSFGKEFFADKITDRVKTYADACEETGDNQIDEIEFLKLGFSIDEIYYRKIKTITKALNEGWVPDWNNSNEKKWAPWFNLSSSAFVFYGADYYYSYAGAGNGSRLCFKSDELAAYAAKQFTELYKGFIK